MTEEDREDWAMLDDIVDELKKTMPSDTEEQEILINTEARKRFMDRLDKDE